MTSLNNLDLIAVIHFGFDEATTNRGLSQTGERIECSKCFGGCLNSFCLRGHEATDVIEELSFQLHDSLFSAKNTLLPVLKFRCGEALGVGECLASFIVFRNTRSVQFRNLGVITKHAVITNAKVADSTARAFCCFE